MSRAEKRADTSGVDWRVAVQEYDQAIRSHDPWTSMTPWHTLPRTKQHRRTSLPVPELCTLITGPQLQV